MKSLLQIPPGSRPWLMAIGALTLVQAALLHWGTQQFSEIRSTPPANEKFSMVLGHEASAWLSERMWLPSPMVFTLPSLEGFSGDAWLRYRTPSVEESPIEDSPTWLKLETNHFGETFRSFADQYAPAPMRVADLPVVWRDNFPIDPPPDRHSELRLQGNLASRRLLSPAQLPDWPHTDVASESQVDVLVDSEGQVVSAVLLEAQGRLSNTALALSSRLPAADAYALDFARQAQFERLRTEVPLGVLADDFRLTSGRLVFHWNTIPIVNTNRSAF